jgi:hypothetical protein
MIARAGGGSHEHPPHLIVLLRDSYGDALAKAGVSVPAGTSPYKYVGSACAGRIPDCQKSMNAIMANAASAVRADANGRGAFPGVPPGRYYLMILGGLQQGVAYLGPSGGT